MTDERFDKLENKLDKVVDATISQELNLQKLTLISEQQQEILSEQKVILDDHIKRTAINEERIHNVESSLVSHLKFIKGFLKGVAWVVGTFTAVLGIMAILSKIGILNF